MAITLRCGAYKDFDPNKLLPAELAIVLEGDPRASNGRSLYACYKPGVVKQIATYEDMVEFLKASMSDTSEQIAEELAWQFTEKLLTATDAANSAAQTAVTATKSITELKSQIQEEESKRASAETKRQQDSAKVIEEANNAAKAANDAAEAANAAAQEGKNYEGVLASFPETGITGISYIDIETNTTYRWDMSTKTYIPIGGGTGDLSIVSDEYASDKNYLVGDYFIRENALYKVIKDKPSGEWDETAVELTTVGKEFKEVNAKMRGFTLWTNPTPTESFAPQKIVLSSNDYDKYKIRWRSASTVSDYFITSEINKGDGTILSLITTGGAGVGAANRRIAYESDTILDARTASFAWGSTAAANNNVWCIPIEVIGFKS